MISLRRIVPAFFSGLLIASCFGVSTRADSSHARIVRLSLVQGDVRFAKDVKDDPLNDAQVVWDAAVLNLPIRQGYVVATDNGRAEIEFENGAMAFLAENSVLQFYDLSSEDGGFTTRLILRQGSAEFYVNPGRGDYFSVTGGDFSVQAETRTTFRMNNFDDGSSVGVRQGRISALANGKTTALSKGESFSMQAGAPESGEIGRAAENDDFDQWVSGRIESVTAANNAATQYTSSAGYISGYGDLYTYGAWFPVAGYGYCWRPYGVAFGWGPFDNGSWFYDPFYGWGFLGGYTWGWLPYHYGGWIFQPGVGWVWSPNGTLGSPGVGRWRPVTGVWMRSSSGTVAIVPAHPLDTHGKAPLNLGQGLFEVTTRGVGASLPVESDARWKVENRPNAGVLQNQIAEASAPLRVLRSMSDGGTVSRIQPGPGASSIVFDRTEHRFVNSNSVAQREGRAGDPGARANEATPANDARTMQRESRGGNLDGRVPAPDIAARAVEPRVPAPQPARATPAPPSVPRSVSNERAFNEGGRGGGPRGSGSNGAASGASRGGGSASSGAAGASMSSGGGRSGGGGSSGGGASAGGGGRPH